MSTRDRFPEEPLRSADTQQSAKKPRASGHALAKRIVGSEMSQLGINQAVRSMVDDSGVPTPKAQGVLLKTLSVQRGVVLANLRRLRRRHPHDSPAQLAYRIGLHFRRAASGSGAAAGAASVVPGIGTIGGLGLSAAASIGFLELSALYAQSIAELHGLPTHDDQHGQALVMTVLLGREGQDILREAGRMTQGSGNLAATVLAVNSGSGLFDALFAKLRDSFVKRFAVSQGASIIGRAIPFGIGAVIGGVGNHKLGTAVIRSAGELFGDFPRGFSPDLALQLEIDAAPVHQALESGPIQFPDRTITPTP